MQKAESTTRQGRVTASRAAWGWLVLAVYTSLLVYRALLHNCDRSATYVPVWELQNSHRLLAWIGGFLLTGLFEFACFIPVGFLAALGLPDGSRPLRHRIALRLTAMAIACMIAILVQTVEAWPIEHLGSLAPLVLTLPGCLFGVWIGATWQHGKRARLWLLLKLALLVLIAAIGIGVLAWLSVEAKPLPFEAATVTSAEKRQLVRRIRSKSPRSLKEGQTHTLRLTEHDVNVLLTWGLSLGSADRKAQVQFTPEAGTLAASIGVRPHDGKMRYLNLQVAGDVQIRQGHLRLNVDRCRLGRVGVPRWLVDPWCPVVASLLAQDRRSKPFLEAIEAAALGPGWVEATYTRVNLPPGFREDLFGPAGAGEALLAATQAQAEHLLATVEQLPRGERPQFDLCVETVFALARDRSVDADPVAENRAAIFALGVLLGHHRIEEFLGPVVPDQGYAALRALRRVRLRERTDWTKHFWVSAAIALLSDTAVSDAAGLFKEELDADVGGSGFSFADLLADRAGTTFAVQATRDEAAARAIQERLAKGFHVDDFFPPASDLPEGISDTELQSRYGGVGGTAYQQLIDEIDRRLATCAAYR